MPNELGMRFLKQANQFYLKLTARSRSEEVFIVLCPAFPPREERIGTSGGGVALSYSLHTPRVNGRGRPIRNSVQAKGGAHDAHRPIAKTPNRYATAKASPADPK